MLGLLVTCKNVTVTSGADHLKQQREQQGLRDLNVVAMATIGCSQLPTYFVRFGLFWASLLAIVAKHRLHFGRSSMFAGRYGK